jgi:sugar lactone lactonase YvrE
LRNRRYATQVISGLIQNNTSTTLGVSATALTYGQSVTLTATVSIVPPGTATPTGGTVTFLDYGTAIGSATLSNGTASFTTTPNYGVHELTASYTTAGMFASSSTAGAGLGRTSIIATVAGNGSGDGAQASASCLSDPGGDALDSAGDLFIADSGDNRVREVNHTTGVITTVAGDGTAGFSGDNGQTTAAMLDAPTAVALDSAGNLYIADTGNQRIRKVNLSTGVITTVAGDGVGGYGGDNVQATATDLYDPQGVAVDSSGNLYIADTYNDRIRKVKLSTGIITTVGGMGSAGYNGDGIAATIAALYDPTGVAVDASGNFYIADSLNNRIRKVTISSGLITTVAGSAAAGYGGDGGAATAAVLNDPRGIAVDATGDLFIADYANARIREVYASTAKIATVAGSGSAGYSGDGGAATAAAISKPQGVAVDAAGNLYIADSGNNRVREVSHASATIATFAGGFLGDGGAATAAILAAPADAAVDSSGDIFIADTNDNRVREVNRATGAITTVAGNGGAGYGGDNGQATAAMLDAPDAVALDSAGNLYIADSGNNRVREVNLSSGLITTVAGNGTAGFSGDGGAATAAEISSPDALAVDGSGHLFIADANNYRIREVNLSSGAITTVAGGGSDGDGDPATTAILNSPQDAVVDSAGNLYIADTNDNRVREVNRASGVITTIAGTGAAGYTGNGGPATAAELSAPKALALDNAGDLFIVDSGNDRVRELNPASGALTTVAGDGSGWCSGDGGPAINAGMSPSAIAVDSSGNLFISDSDRVREVYHASGTINTVAGNGNYGFSGDNGPATAAEMWDPAGIALDAAGDLLIADEWNNRIREVNHFSGIITTVAGDGSAFWTGDGGPATAATLWLPTSVAVDSAGDIFIADNFNDRIREVNASSGIITTVAGDGSSGCSGDGGPATAAALSPATIAVDSSGNLYIADSGDNRIREVNHTTNLISTVAGTGFTNYGGDGGPATAAVMNKPKGLAVDSLGNLYIADSANDRIRKVNLSSGVITSVAGNGSAGSSGDGGAATAARLNQPEGLAVDAAGNLYIADTDDDRIRELNASTGIISTIAGATNGFSGDGGAAGAALLASPAGLAVDASGDLYIADSGNNRIREVAFGGTVLTVNPASASGTTITLGSATTTYGGSVALAATLLCGGIPVSGQSIVFTLNGSPLPTVVSNAAGVATFAAVGLTGYVPGTYAGYLGAAFAGNSLLGTSSAAASLTVTPAPLTVAAKSASKIYGTADPAFSVSYSGFVSGEGPANLGGTLVYWTNEPDSGFAPTGAYIIWLAGLTSSNYAITFLPATLTVAAAATSTTLGASTTSGIYGQSVTLTATVAAAAPSAAAPTGSIVFTAGGAILGTVALNGGSATLTTTAIAAGMQWLAANYIDNSDADFSASASSGMAGATITTVAGGGNQGLGDNGQATAAELNEPNAVAVDSAEDVFVADTDDNRIREVNAAGLITTVAGNGTSGYSGDNGPPTAAELDDPTAVVVDSAGDIFIADAGNQRVREVSHLTGLITTIGGNGTRGYSGDNGPATAAELSKPDALALDSAGNLFIVDGGNDRIRELNLSTGVITTVAGDGSGWYSGDGGAATSAGMSPVAVAIDSSGNLYISDSNRVREVNHAKGVINTVAGNGNYAFGGDNGPATAASMWGPDGIAVDAAGNLYIADEWNDRIREVNPATGVITTVAGNGGAFCTGDGGPATAATLWLPTGVAVGSTGNLFIADNFNGRVRELTPPSPPVAISLNPAPLTITANSQTMVYGGAPPTLTASYTGLVDGDQSTSLATAPSLATAATSASSVGSYLITVNGAVDANYTISYVLGTLTVTPAPLTVTAGNQSKVYGGTDPALNYMVAGTFYNGDGPSLISGVTLATTTGAAATAGTHAITASGGTAANYAIIDVSGTLTVAFAPLTVTADDQSKVYGVADPALTYTPGGTLYYGDQYSLIVEVAISTATGAAATAGTHTIAVSGGTAANYTITDVNGTLTVAPAPLTVTANNQTKAYGAADPQFTVGYSGFQYGQTLATSGVSGTPSLTSSDNATSPPGSYTITAALGTLSAEDYSFSFANGTLTILPPPTFLLTGPSTATFTSGHSITIRWTAANVDLAGPTKITLGYDADATAFDANEHWIEVDQVTASNGAASYSWNTAGVAGGSYHLSGYSYDFSTDQAVFAHLDTSIVIAVGAPVPTTALTLTGPNAGTFSTGQSVSIQWTAADVDVAGPTKITLGYDADATAFDANEHWIEVDEVTAANGAGSYSWNSTGVASGTYYLSGYMYDFATSRAVYSSLTTSIVVAGSNPPSFALTGPSERTFTAGQTATIKWTAANVDVAGPTKISLGYDHDATPFDANEHWLEVDQVTASNGAASYSWNTTGVASGTYYLSGYMYDFATGHAVYSSLNTSIVITGGNPPAFTLSGPSAGTFAPGQSVTIQWSATNVDVAGPTKITLGYDRDATPFDANEHWIEIDGVTAAKGAASYSWNTAGVAPGTYYLSGYMYDFSTGHAVYSAIGTSIVIS